MWDQFRRLLLGTVVEVLLEHDVEVDFKSIEITFDRESKFNVPRLNNYMRFKGSLRARAMNEVPPHTQRALSNSMRSTWPALLKVVDIPIGDRLTPERTHVQVGITESILVVAFDLEAD